MYICPKCHEEIPDRIRSSQDECPFCQEPWPGEVVIPQQPQAQASPSPSGALKAPLPVGYVAPPQSEGSGTDAGPEQASHAEQYPEPKKSKLWLYILCAVLVLGAGGFALYHFKLKKKKGTGGGVEFKVGDQTVRVKKLYEEEYEGMLRWQKDFRKKILKYFTDRCDTYRAKGFKFASRLDPVERMISARKKIRELKLKIDTISGTETPKDNFNWFNCPSILAFVHKEHQMIIEMDFTIKERTLGATLRRASVEIKGGRFVAGKGKYRSSYDTTSGGGLRLSALKNKSHDPSVQMLHSNQMSRVDNNTFKLSGITFTRIKRHKGSSKEFLVGLWQSVSKTDTFLKLLETWYMGCRRLKREIEELNKRAKEEKFKIEPLLFEAKNVAQEVCQGMQLMFEGAKGKWESSKIEQARKHLSKALEIAKKNINKPLLDMAEHLKSDQKPIPWCGALEKGSACK